MDGQRLAAADLGARFRRLLLANNPQHFIEGRRAQACLRSNGVSPVNKFIKQNAQRVDVAAGVDVELIALSLFGAHVFQRAHDLTELREHRLFGQTSG